MIDVGSVQRLHDGAGAVRDVLILAGFTVFLVSFGQVVVVWPSVWFANYGIALCLTLVRWMCRRSGLAQ